MKFIQQNLPNVIITTLGVAALAVLLLSPSPVTALGLKIAPLKYEERIELGSSKSGFVDVANPNDATITVTASVRGFKQIDLDGNLEFYQDDQLSEGIVVNVDKFDLGPREAARILFTVESNKLPEGGIYAVLFFETTAQKASPVSTSIETGSRVGTLLILENGDRGVREGSVEKLDIDFWQFGSGIEGDLTYHNPESELAIGYNPELSAKVLWGQSRDIASGLVLPGSSRNFEVGLRGHYFGLLPVTATDTTTGSEVTAWVLAVTGVWRIILPSILAALLATIGLHRYFSRRR